VKAPGNGRQGVRDKEEGIRLVFRQDFLELEIGLPPFFPIKGMTALRQEFVDLWVLVEL
jgi:hypothetical protein